MYNYFCCHSKHRINTGGERQREKERQRQRDRKYFIGSSEWITLMNTTVSPNIFSIYYNSSSKISKWGGGGRRPSEPFLPSIFLSEWKYGKLHIWIGQKGTQIERSWLEPGSNMVSHKGRKHKAGTWACPALLPLLATGNQVLILWLLSFKPGFLHICSHAKHVPKHVHAQSTLMMGAPKHVP